MNGSYDGRELPEFEKLPCCVLLEQLASDRHCQRVAVTRTQSERSPRIGFERWLRSSLVLEINIYDIDN